MRRILLLPAPLFLLAALAAGKNVDLVTLPDRASVQLTIYNSEDLTLVRETREVALKRGRNELQFSWANTLIDPTSVEFRALERADEIELVDTRFPGSKPQHLVWTIDSGYEGQVKVEVSYFTSGITWSMDYVALTDAVRIGARQAAVSRSIEPENTRVPLVVAKVERAGANLDTSKLQVSVTPWDPVNNVSAWVQSGDVTVVGQYPYKINILGLVVFRGTIKSRTTERVE